VAVTTTPKLDAHKLRADFPVFEQPIHGKPLAFLDSAVTSQKPRQVLDAIRDFYATSYSNVHRGVYTLSERATEGYEGAREKVRTFLNAASTREVIFTRQATEALYLVAYAWGLDNLGPGDLALVTELEHHSNFVPWQQIARRTGADFRMLPIDDLGELRMDLLDEVAGDARVKVVAANLVSNSLGTINPIERLAAWAHERGAIMVVDAAQAAPHRRIDVQTLGADFVAFSSHKMCGPTGAGVLWGRRELLEAMSPFNYGGSMIRSVKVEETLCPTSSRPARPRSRRRTGSAWRSTTSRRSGSRRSSSTSTSSPSTRSSGWPSCRSSLSTGHRRTGASGSSRSTSRVSTRTTSRRCSTGRGSRSGPATTAASR
jgi:cysteine desulfurase/selenocysteine lyase